MFKKGLACIFMSITMVFSMFGVNTFADMSSASSAIIRNDETPGSYSGNGPYTYSKYTLPRNPSTGGATVYYPTGSKAVPPFSGLVYCPPFSGTQSMLAAWGPFFASHGIVLVTFDTRSTSDSVDSRSNQQKTIIDALKAENTRSSSPLNGKLATDRVGAMGWSMGGGATWINSGEYSGLTTAMSLAGHNQTATNPSSKGKNTKCPTLIMNGARDNTMLGGMGQSSGVYDSIPSGVPKVIYEVSNAGHMSWNSPTSASRDVASISLAFQKTFLDGDTRWAKYIAKPSSNVATWKTANITDSNSVPIPGNTPVPVNTPVLGNTPVPVKTPDSGSVTPSLRERIRERIRDRIRERWTSSNPTTAPVLTPQPTNNPNVSPIPTIPYNPQTDFSNKGPFSTTSMKMSNHTVYYPRDLGSNDMKHPIIIWGNGTGASPSSYTGIFNHLASYGFVVIAANTPSAGSGAEMIQGIDIMISENQKPDSVFYNKLNAQAIGASGHSQGGIGTAAAAAKDNRIVCSIPLMGTGMKAISSPMLIVAGSSDTIVSPSLVKMLYSSAKGTAIYAELQGASHMAPVGPSPSKEILHYSVAWFRLYLMGDTSLSSVFFDSGSGINADSDWKITSKNIPN